MQPITQASLDPKLNDIGKLRAEQRLDGVIGCFGPSILYRGTTRAFPIPLSGKEFYYDSNLPSSNPTPSAAKPPAFPVKTWVRRRLWRLTGRLTRGQGSALDDAACASMHVHGRAGKPKQLARNAKNPGKTRVLQRRGQESNFWVFSQWFWGVREVVFRSKVIENEEIRSTTASPRRA